MRVLLSQLRTRLILGSLVFLLGLTVAVILVVRDILSFSARNMASVAQQALIDQQRIALLEITKREAELSDHAIHHNPSDLAPLDQRLQNLQLAPGAFAFVIDAEGRLVAVSSEQVGIIFDKESSANHATRQGVSLLQIHNSTLQKTLLAMQTDKSGTDQIELETGAALIAFAPLTETGWSFAIVEPISSITAGAAPLSEKIGSEQNRILRAALLTIAYFTILVVIGAVLAARALTGPIQALVEGTRSIAAGDLTVRLPVKSSDELGVLAASFNQMVEELQARNAELT